MRNLYEEIRPLEESDFEEDIETQNLFLPLFSSKELEEKKDRNIEEEVRKVFEDAYKEGEKAGYEVGFRKAENLIRRLNSYLFDLERFKEELLKRSEDLCLQLSILFAEALILKELKTEKEILRNMIKKALEICDEKTEITIRIRKEDAKYIEEDSNIKIVPDDTLREGGFVIETNFGYIDGSISVQIEELRKRFIND